MISEQTPALQQVLLEMTRLGIPNPRDSTLYRAIRWLMAEHAYIRLQESSSSTGTALSNMRREAAYWKAELESPTKQED